MGGLHNSTYLTEPRTTVFSVHFHGLFYQGFSNYSKPILLFRTPPYPWAIEKELKLEYYENYISHKNARFVKPIKDKATCPCTFLYCYIAKAFVCQLETKKSEIEMRKRQCHILWWILSTTIHFQKFVVRHVFYTTSVVWNLDFNTHKPISGKEWWRLALNQRAWPP